MKLFTIGFAGKPAEDFFSRLRNAGVRRLVDIRLNPGGQLSGFAKDRDLPYFLRELCGIDYVALPLLAPPKELLDGYRKRLVDWTAYERIYLAELAARGAAEKIPAEVLADACLLCSEENPKHCHRRLAAETLAARYPEIAVTHL